MLQEVNDQSQLWSRAHPKSTTSLGCCQRVGPAALEVHPSHPKLPTPLIRHQHPNWIGPSPSVLYKSWTAMVLPISFVIASRQTLAGFGPIGSWGFSTNQELTGPAAGKCQQSDKLLFRCLVARSSGWSEMV